MSARIRQLTGLAVTLASVLASASCGNVARTGRSPQMLVIAGLQAEAGSKPGLLGVPLLSDVQTMVKKSVNGVDVQVPTYYNDLGHVTLRAVLKDQGAPGVTATPSNLNQITITRYRVVFVRADGRKVEGVDVPFAFDGGLTATVGPTDSTLGFELVRSTAKLEAPLHELVGLGGRLEIATIAYITFYGADLAGNEVQATGTISVDFADFGDAS